MFAHQSFYGIVISKGCLEYSARSLVLFEMFFFLYPFHTDISFYSKLFLYSVTAVKFWKKNFLFALMNLMKAL